MDIESAIDHYGTYIYNYALRLCCNPNLAEDLAQETFIKAWQKNTQLINHDSLRPWLRKICLNTYLMHLRKENNLTELIFEDPQTLESAGTLFDLVSVEPSPLDEVVVEESIRELQNGCFLAMTRKLSIGQRIAFSLIDMFGVTLDEVSELLCLSKGAVKGLLYRARMNLDHFFHHHCNLIQIDNPCSCKAWIGFAENRNKNLDASLKARLEQKLDYTKSGYTFSPETRQKIYTLYANMPDRKPSGEWYQNVIMLIKEMYVSKDNF